MDHPVNFTFSTIKTGTKVLPKVSLKESGKSRADLWQLAANTAIDIAVADANLACDDLGDSQILQLNVHGVG